MDSKLRCRVNVNVKIQTYPELQKWCAESYIKINGEKYCSVLDS